MRGCTGGEALKTASAKAKGRKCQQMTASLFLSHDPTGKLTDRDFRSVPGGTPGVDVWMSEQAVAVFPIDAECKWHESLDLRGAYEQAQSHNAGGVPVVFHKKNNQPLLATLDAEEFIKFVAKAYKGSDV